VKLPKGDVLIHAGDLTNQGSYSEVGSFQGSHLDLADLRVTALQGPPVARESRL
jgi:hypothetical protein